MEEQEITEGNKLIAEFMCWEKRGMKDLELWNMFFEHWGINTQELEFHSSWDWLMPAVEKCLCTPHEGNLHMKINDALLTINIKEMWLTVVEFIKWYNQNKNI